MARKTSLATSTVLDPSCLPHLHHLQTHHFGIHSVSPFFLGSYVHVSVKLAQICPKKDYGMVHFVMFDTETDLGKGLIGPEEFGGRQLLDNGPFGTENQQISFLDADLSSVNRKVTRMYMCFFFSFVNWEGKMRHTR